MRLKKHLSHSDLKYHLLQLILRNQMNLKRLICLILHLYL
jgi:hypothetical protein